MCKRLSPKKVEITYASYGKLCPLAKGLIKGVAAYYKEAVKITEPTCMLRGDKECRLVVEQSISDSGIRSIVNS
jgi:predicted hydrocarbon binding protein